MLRTNKLKWLNMLLVAVMIAAIGVPAWKAEPVQAEESGVVYYVDAAGGDDGQAGTSEGSAWKSLNKVNATVFQPGDTILFKAGGAWKGTLYPKGSGAAGSPIRIDKYGEGPKPLIAGDGADAAVYFYSQEYWEVRNLEITNHAATQGERRGVHVAGHSGGWNNPKVYRHFVFEYLDIHNVKGSLSMDYAHNGGIIVWDPSWNYVVTDVTIRNNKIYSMDSVGIYLNGGSRPYSFNNTVADNVIYDIGGDGAFVLNTTNGVIERNVVYDTHKRSTSYHVPLWVFESKDSVIQYNEVFNTYPGGDAMAYDSDYKSEGTVIQYNYSHNNAGGLSLAVNDGTQSGSYNRDTVIRYNISQNDLGAVFNFSGTPENTHIYNNTVYIPPNSTTKVVDTLNWGGWAKNTNYTNNLIVNLGSGGYNFGSSTNNVFDNNLFYGNHPVNVLNMDANKIVADPMLAAPGTGRIGRDTLAGYQLLETSPAIGAGKLVADNGGFDFFGNPVPEGANPNIGAYEGPGIPEGQIPPGAEIVNLLANPGFEDGVFGGWGTSYNGAAIVDQGARSGNYAAVLANAVSGIEQTVTVKPNTIYKLSGYTRSEGGGSAVIGVKNYGNPSKDVFVSGATYTGREVVFTTGSANTTAVIFMYKQGGTGTVAFDDMLLFEYGEVSPPGIPPELPPEPLPGKQNLSPQATLTASSSNPAYLPSLAVDGSLDATSRWITLGGSQAPHWLELSWEESYDIDRVRLWSGAGAGTAGWQIRDFQIQYWENGEWKVAASVTNNTMDGRISAFNDLVFPVVHTDKIRLWVTKGTTSAQSNDNGARVFEIQVWEHDPNPVEPEVTPVYVIGVQVGSANRITKLDAGGTLAMAAEVKPANADDRTVSWRVEGLDGEVTTLASIGQNGVLTALSPGKVKVVAEVNDGTGIQGESVIEITAPPAHPNIAPYASVTASTSHENGNFPPSLVVNGIRHVGSDRWVTGANGPHGLELQWSTVHEVNQVRLWSGQIDAKGMQLVDFELQMWDGSAWQTVRTVTGNEDDNYYGQFTDLIFAPIVTDRLRLSITKGNPVFDDRARLFEIEVYGEPATAEPKTLPAVQMSGPAEVYAGQPLSLSVSATESTYAYSAINAIVAYDPEVIDFETAESGDGLLELAGTAITSIREGLSVLGTAVKPSQGLINVLLSAPGGSLAEAGELFRLHGKVKDDTPALPTQVSLAKFEIVGHDQELHAIAVDAAGASISVTAADRTALGNAIADARAMHDAATEGTAEGQYPAGSKESLRLAIEAAEAVYQQPNASQLTVNEALAGLSAAVQSFAASVIQPPVVIREELGAALEQARVLLERASTGTKVGNYPQSAVTAFDAAIAAAGAIYNESHSQPAVDAAAEQLVSETAIFRASRITLVDGESQVTLKTLSIVAGYFGRTSSDADWSEVEAADMLDQGEITIQSLAAVARMILTDWFHER
ncbi:discoidin domain-containing protein [Paenibacillus sp. LHD-117]|uniref:galactose-binding domain-containing protein n=1 Tax=Paenibacillus sp. LHD-117 TaxID=3071412 RepID=UPI0027E1BE78|nr:discoidin domain-containing protein [Paenibacillus sp. LHD-117]MDQ6419885.1 discoidin domain-containing protein [Paenibacillus sp. LHD-117]